MGSASSNGDVSGLLQHSAPSRRPQSSSRQATRHQAETTLGCAFLGWYYEHNGRMVGPVPLADVAQAVRSGQTTKVWKGYKDGGQLGFLRTRVAEVLAGNRPTSAGHPLP